MAESGKAIMFIVAEYKNFAFALTAGWAESGKATGWRPVARKRPAGSNVAKTTENPAPAAFFFFAKAGKIQFHH